MRHGNVDDGGGANEAVGVDGCWVRGRRPACKMTWQSGLMRVTRNHVPSGAQVRILVSSLSRGLDYYFLISNYHRVLVCRDRIQ